jgi:hypothetical protein
MRKIAFAGILLVTAGLLTACGISQDEQAACENSGGVTSSPTFRYSEGGWFGPVSTGRVNICEQNGQITEVYNDEITDPDSGWFGPSGDNRRIYDECTATEGRVYRTTVSHGKTSSTRWVCIQGGEYVQILK